MPNPPKNTSCGSPNIFGPINRYLFLGCSVVEFSGSAGWNEQQTELTVKLVRDLCPSVPSNPKYYFDLGLVRRIWEGPDPGFFGLEHDIIGAPVYFRVDNFEFSGLIQSWQAIDDSAGGQTFTVKIIDPRILLQQTQLIISDYAGGVGNVYNLINVYGFLESLGNSCPPVCQPVPGIFEIGACPPDGAIWGSPAFAFGGAQKTGRGIRVQDIILAASLLLSGHPPITNIWSPYGRMMFKGPNTVHSSGMGLFPIDTPGLAHYYVDLSDLPTPPPYWRNNNNNISLLELVSQLSEDAGHDYYIELVPVFFDGAIRKIIKVRTVDRFAAPLLNGIETFIGAGRQVESYSLGRELRTDPTQTFVIGGNTATLVQSSEILPYIGVHLNGNVIEPVPDGNGGWDFTVSTLTLPVEVLVGTVKINSQELIAARSSIDAWSSYASIHNTELWQALNLDLKGLADLGQLLQLLNNAPQNQLRPGAAANNKAAENRAEPDNSLEKLQRAYEWIKKFADTYATHFQVPVPFTCGYIDPESGQVVTNDKPANSGFTEHTSILGLPHPSIYTEFFKQADGKIGAFCRFAVDTIINPEGKTSLLFSPDQAIVVNGSTFVGADVLEEYQYLDKATLISPRVVFSIPDPNDHIENNGPVDWSLLKKVIEWIGGNANAKQEIDKVLERTGSTAHNFNYTELFKPSGVCFGIESSALTYGPWFGLGAPGGVDVRRDESLVPWEFGGYANLNLAGNATAQEGLTNQRIVERGSVTIAGYPELPLGAELLAADAGGPFAGGTGPNLFENRTGILDSFGGFNYLKTSIYLWSGTFGPNVTDLSVSVSDNGVKTTYNIQTWTPRFGRFQKGNAERLKILAKRLNTLNETQKKFIKEGFRVGGIRLTLDGKIGKSKKLMLNKERGDRTRRKQRVLDGKSPHEALIGEYGKWNNAQYIRPWVVSESIFETILEIQANYANKALMSLDGLVRPISIFGAGNFSRFYTSESGSYSLNPGAHPPVDPPSQGGNKTFYNFKVHAHHLNPFANPSSPVAARSDTPNIGHDIELVGRENNPPDNLYLPEQGYIETQDPNIYDYAEDYRVFALRGPLVIQGWGYDLDGFPIPNKADTEAAAAQGQFTSNNLQRKFLDGFLRKSHTWPVAPVDLRFDRKRGVWTVPQHRQIVAQLLQKVGPQECGKAKVLNHPTLWDNSGNLIENPEILVCDAVGNCHASGAIVEAYFDPDQQQYRIVESATANEEIFRFRLLECVGLNFNHRANNTARGMRQKYNYVSHEWIDDYEVLLKPLSSSALIGIGPAPSGALGWAKVLAPPTALRPENFPAITCDNVSEEYKQYLKESGVAHVIHLDPVAEYIEFVTNTNVGCVDNMCFNSVPLGRAAEASTTYWWDGHKPEGDIVVVWSSAEDITCLPGYGKCSAQDFVPLRGIAVLDRKRSSEAIQYSSGCRNEQNCGKWVYNVVEWNKLPRITRLVNGAPDPNFRNIPFYELQVGSGLFVNKINDCSIHIYGSGGSGSGIAILDTNCCNFDKQVEQATVFNATRLNFGAGLRIYENCKDELSGLVSGTGIFNIVAGITPTNSNEIFNIDEDTLSPDQIFSQIVLQGGLKAADSDDSNKKCEMRLRSGVYIHESTQCIKELTGSPNSNHLYHFFVLHRGLKAKAPAQDGGTVELGAGIDVETVDWCEEGYGQGSIQAPQHKFLNLMSKLSLGAGLRIGEDSFDPCNVYLRAGALVYSTTEVANGDFIDNTLASKIVFGKGISADTPDACTVRISVEGGSLGFLTGSDCICCGAGSGHQYQGHVTEVDFASVLKFVRGLRVEREISTNYLKLQAGVHLGDKLDNYLDSDDVQYPNELISTIKAARGIRIRALENQCTALISAGIKVKETLGFCNPSIDGCTAVEGDVNYFASTLSFGKGLIARNINDETVRINLDMLVNGCHTAEMSFGGAFNVECNNSTLVTTINLRDAFLGFGTSPPTGYNTKDEIHSIGVNWCEDANGNCILNSLVVYKQRTHFNEYGQIIYVEDLGSEELHPGPGGCSVNPC